MKRASAIFLQVLIVLIGIGVLAFMLLEPIFEGRNLHSTLTQVYFNDPFLIYAYTASIAFFLALYQTFKVLNYIGQNKVFSQDSVKALRTIKYCGMTLVGFILVPLAYLFIVRPGDDIAGGVFMGLLIFSVSAIIANIANVLEGLVQSVLDKKR